MQSNHADRIENIILILKEYTFDFSRKWDVHTLGWIISKYAFKILLDIDF